MESSRVLLIDTSNSFKRLLEAAPQDGSPGKFVVSLVRPASRMGMLRKVEDDIRAVVFGAHLSFQVVGQCARTLRENGIAVPMFVLREGSGTVIPKDLRKLGVDEVLDVAELDSPVFSWTFMSLLRQAENRRKASAFDTINGRMEDLKESLAFITHEIVNPLSVIRLGLYHLQNFNISGEKREELLKLLLENAEKIQAQMEELRSVRSTLREESKHRSAGLIHHPQPERKAAVSS